jgi:hypothetical protein
LAGTAVATYAALLSASALGSRSDGNGDHYQAGRAKFNVGSFPTLRAVSSGWSKTPTTSAGQKKDPDQRGNLVGAMGGRRTKGVTESSTYRARLQPRMAASLAAKVLSPIEALLFVMFE